MAKKEKRSNYQKKRKRRVERGHRETEAGKKEEKQRRKERTLEGSFVKSGLEKGRNGQIEIRNDK